MKPDGQAVFRPKRQQTRSYCTCWFFGLDNTNCNCGQFNQIAKFEFMQIIQRALMIFQNPTAMLCISEFENVRWQTDVTFQLHWSIRCLFRSVLSSSKKLLTFSNTQRSIPIQPPVFWSQDGFRSFSRVIEQYVSWIGSLLNKLGFKKATT